MYIDVVNMTIADSSYSDTSVKFVKYDYKEREAKDYAAQIRTFFEQCSIAAADRTNRKPLTKKQK